MKFEANTRNNSEYIVKNGDSLYKIAKDNDITVQELLEINGLDSAYIYPNQVLIIPKPGNNGNIYFVEYMVEIGDTLEAIANKNNTTVNALNEYNDVGKLLLATDQVLNIPYKYNVYTIKQNDTLDSILNNANMTLEEFVNANFKNILPVGKKVFIR